MITLEKAHELIQEHLGISEEEYVVKYFKETSFGLEGKGFKISIGSGFINEFRITQYPFENLYFGLDFNYHDHTVETVTYILKRIRSYINAFKKMITKSIGDMA